MAQKIVPLNVPRDVPFSVLLAKDEHKFFVGLAEQLGTTLSAVIRNAASAALMSTEDPVATAHEQHVNALARVDKWRRDRDAKSAPTKLPVLS